MFYDQSVVLFCYEHQFMVAKFKQLKTQTITTEYVVKDYFYGILEESINYGDYWELTYIGNFKIKDNIDSLDQQKDLYYYDSYYQNVYTVGINQFVLDEENILTKKHLRTRVPPKDLVCYVKYDRKSDTKSISIYNFYKLKSYCKMIKCSGAVLFSNKKGSGVMYLDCSNWSLLDLNKKIYYLSRCLQWEFTIKINLRLNPSYRIMYNSVEIDIYYVEHDLSAQTTKLICKYTTEDYKYSFNSSNNVI